MENPDPCAGLFLTSAAFFGGLPSPVLPNGGSALYEIRPYIWMYSYPGPPIYCAKLSRVYNFIKIIYNYIAE